MVKQGDRVKVDGSESVVTSLWGQGKHTAYALQDGRTVLDLIDDQVVQPEPVVRPKPLRVREERMPRVDEDIEE